MLKDQSKEDSFFDSPAYSLTKRCLILSGGWPYLSPRRRKTTWFAVNIFVATAWFPELFHIIKIIDQKREVIYCSMSFLCTYLAFVSSINAAVKSHSMRRLLDSVRENWNNLKSDDERKIFAMYANYGKLFTISLTFAYYMVLLSYIVFPLISPALHYLDTGNWTRLEKNILEVEYYVIDLQEYYWSIFVHGSLACTAAVWLMLAYDVLFGTVVQHCCGMFTVLGYRIRQMDVMLYNYSYDRQLALKNIEDIVMYHLACLEFAQRIEDFFCFQLIIQIVVNTIVISVCGSQVIQLADTSLQESFRFLYLASATAFRLTLMNVFGQAVYDHSLEIHDHLIHTNWYEYPIQVRKLFIILYNRSAEPCNLTAAKMVNLNLDTYSKLMKTAMSYFMMIIQTL